MQDTGKSLEFRHWGDASALEEDLRPVTNAVDLLRCKMSDLFIEHRNIQSVADAIKKSIDAMIITKKILEEAQ